MDADGLWRRRKGSVADSALLAEAPEYEDAWKAATVDEREDLREEIWTNIHPATRDILDAERTFPLSRVQFDALSYDAKLKVCARPEHLDGPDVEAWHDINEHLGTRARSIADLVGQLGVTRFGRRPRVGDCFSGGGSIPFEAARIGCEAFGSDLNPVAAMLTWAALNLVGGGRDVQARVFQAQTEAFAAAQKQVEEWGIERSDEGWRAEAYLYCVEVRPPDCEYSIPLVPNLVISDKFRVCGVLRLDLELHTTRIDVVSDAPGELWDPAQAGETGTVKNGRVLDPFDPDRSWSVEGLRGPEGLRRWEKEDVAPRVGDVFRDRLYCIRWRKPDGTRAYRAPTRRDLENEQRVMNLLSARLEDWSSAGFIPSGRIEPGYNTDQPIRERGWSHWHQMFTPRQLLLNGLLNSQPSSGQAEFAAKSLLVGRLTNYNSKLSRWKPRDGGGIGGVLDTFFNQALNTMYNFASRATSTTESLFLRLNQYQCAAASVQVRDARDVTQENDLWVTDPPYADAINYHELADFFLGWYEGGLSTWFPEWTADGRAALAVKGTGDDFKRSMVEIYANLTAHMPDNGLQMVQFTHKDPSVWADLGMILWAAGLRVTAAWTIATETPAGGIKKGNYVQGTVLLILRKRLNTEPGFLDDVYAFVEDEVKQQIDSMRALDEGSEPNFGDTDYQLAAYAAALRVLTQYQTLDGQDVGHELFRARPTGRGRAATAAKSKFEQVIERGIEIACDYLVPKGLDAVWQGLRADERLYLRAVDVESRGERRQGVYDELARGFGVREVRPILHAAAANNTRVRTPSEFGRKDLGGDGFAGTKLRTLIFAIHTTVKDEHPEGGLRYLKDELHDAYWTDRQRMTTILDWLAVLGQGDAMPHWKADSNASRLLAGRLRADHG